jgi:8-oxo-dGTP diphosphatase
VEYEAKGRPKIVRYWLMEAESGGDFVPNDEVDEVRWLPFDDALSLLSYDRDHDLVRAALG